LVSGVAEELVSELSKLIRKMQYSRQLLLWEAGSWGRG
jgi:hypothetical protein